MLIENTLITFCSYNNFVILMHWSQFRGSLLKSAQNLGIRIISIVWLNSVFKLWIWEEVTLTSVTCTNWFMVCPFFQTLLLVTIYFSHSISETIPPTYILMIQLRTGFEFIFRQRYVTTPPHVTVAVSNQIFIVANCCCFYAQCS